MASPLFSIVPLLLGADAAASPPVPATRVTGNVSTEHHTRRAAPPTDACRVTGNLFGGMKAPASCTLASAGGEELVVAAEYYAQEGPACVATGAWVDLDGERVCELPSEVGGAPLHVPAAFVEVGEPES